MAKMTRTNRIVKIEGMNVAGGDLPKNFSVKINVEIDCTKTTIEKLIEVACSGQSARVRLQANLRTWSTERLEKVEKEGLKITFEEIYKEESLEDKILKLSKAEFVELMVTYDMDKKGAEALYNKKHGIQ